MKTPVLIASGLAIFIVLGELFTYTYYVPFVAGYARLRLIT